MKKKYKNKMFTYHFPVVCFLAIFCTISCSEDVIPDEPDDNNSKDKAEYSLLISSNADYGGYGGLPLIGDSVGSNWDPSLGIIWLGTDENNLPTGTLTILIDTIVHHSNTGEIAGHISSAMLSTTDQLVGTGAEINAKLYNMIEIGENFAGYGESNLILWIDEIGENYISANLRSLPMREKTTDELIYLSGSFTALSYERWWDASNKQSFSSGRKVSNWPM